MAESTESQEMYLVTIDKLQKRLGIVRSIDIAVERGFSKSTVHVALKCLESKGFINFLPGNITLTEAGKQKAQSIEDKHELIYNALVKLGASKEAAEENACSIEHAMTDEVFELLRKHVAFGEQMVCFMGKTRDDFLEKVSKD